MVELTFSTILRRSAAVLRKRQSATRSLSFSKSCANVRQTWQGENYKGAAVEHMRILSEEVANSTDTTLRSSENTKIEEATTVCNAESKKSPSISAEDLRYHVTHIIENGEDIDGLQEGLAQRLPNVEVLYLFDNRLSEVVGLGLWSRLRRVYLQNNLIRSLRGAFDNLPSLEELNVDGNRIQRLEGLTACTCLTRLSLANQQTTKPLTFDLESLRALSKSLRLLNISHNRVEDLRLLAVLGVLESLEAAFNDVRGLEVIGVVLAGCRHLKTLNLCNNPVSRTPKRRQYLRYILLHASGELCDLDGRRVANVQRAFIQDMHRYLRCPQRQRTHETAASIGEEAVWVE